MRVRELLLWIAMAAQAASCAAPADDPSQPIVSCAVCAYEGDMGCVRVRLRPDTPRLTWHGKEYFFCSDECRRYFERNPERYAHALD